LAWSENHQRKLNKNPKIKNDFLIGQEAALLALQHPCRGEAKTGLSAIAPEVFEEVPR
jgi:hypothetical protein